MYDRDSHPRSRAAQSGAGNPPAFGGLSGDFHEAGDYSAPSDGAKRVGVTLNESDYGAGCSQGWATDSSEWGVSGNIGGFRASGPPENVSVDSPSLCARTSSPHTSKALSPPPGGRRSLGFGERGASSAQQSAWPFPEPSSSQSNFPGGWGGSTPPPQPPALNRRGHGFVRHHSGGSPLSAKQYDSTAAATHWESGMSKSADGRKVLPRSGTGQGPSSVWGGGREAPVSVGFTGPLHEQILKEAGISPADSATARRIESLFASTIMRQQVQRLPTLHGSNMDFTSESLRELLKQAFQQDATTTPTNDAEETPLFVKNTFYTVDDEELGVEEERRSRTESADAILQGGVSRPLSAAMAQLRWNALRADGMTVYEDTPFSNPQEEAIGHLHSSEDKRLLMSTHNLASPLAGPQRVAGSSAPRGFSRQTASSAGGHGSVFHEQQQLDDNGGWQIREPELTALRNLIASAGSLAGWSGGRDGDYEDAAWTSKEFGGTTQDKVTDFSVPNNIDSNAASSRLPSAALHAAQRQSESFLELEQQAAVYRALASYLATGRPPQSAAAAVLQDQLSGTERPFDAAVCQSPEQGAARSPPADAQNRLVSTSGPLNVQGMANSSNSSTHLANPRIQQQRPAQDLPQLSPSRQAVAALAAQLSLLSASPGDTPQVFDPVAAAEALQLALGNTFPEADAGGDSVGLALQGLIQQLTASSSNSASQPRNQPPADFRFRGASPSSSAIATEPSNFPLGAGTVSTAGGTSARLSSPRGSGGAEEREWTAGGVEATPAAQGKEVEVVGATNSSASEVLDPNSVEARILRLKKLPFDQLPASKTGKSTIMLRNIPNKYTTKMLLDVIDENFRSLYDFFYLPIDFRNNCNVGYAFVNFIHPCYAELFREKYGGFKLPAFKSNKVCEVSWGRVQGLKANVEHYRNSAVMSVPVAHYKPMLFDSDGERLPFPVADGPLPAVRLRPQK